MISIQLCRNTKLRIIGKRVVLGVFVILVFIGCKNNRDMAPGIKIRNKLGKRIICIFGYNYPDLGLKFISRGALLADSNLFQFDSGEVKELDTLGLVKKDVWDKHVKSGLLELFVFDKKKLVNAKLPEDALLERYYFSYTQVLKRKGIIEVY